MQPPMTRRVATASRVFAWSSFGLVSRPLSGRGLLTRAPVSVRLVAHSTMTDENTQTTLAAFNPGSVNDPEPTELAERVEEIDARTEKLTEAVEKLTEQLDELVPPAADEQPANRNPDRAFH